jgi:pimeloyl-ACP methyl ester carboxylesterase
VAQSAFTSDGRQQISDVELTQVKAPALIVWGAEDPVFPLDHALNAASSIPDAILRILPAVGHVPQVEAAPALSQALDRFARSLAR